MMQSRQTGVTLVGFIVILIVIGFFIYMGMKLVPPYMDYMGVSNAMKEEAAKVNDGETKGQIRRDFMVKVRYQYAGKVIQPSDVTFVRSDSGTDMKVAYDQRVHFVYNIDFLLHFHKRVRLQGNLVD